MQEDYYSVLARMIAATAQDEGQLRRMVYELARNKLRRQLYLQYQHLRRPDMEDQLIELETAITQIESDAAQDVPLLSLPQRNAMNGDNSAGRSTGTDLVLHQSNIQATVLNANLVEILGPATPAPMQQLQRMEPAHPLPPLAEFDTPYRPVWPSETPRSRFLVQGSAPAGGLRRPRDFCRFRSPRRYCVTVRRENRAAGRRRQPAAAAGGSECSPCGPARPRLSGAEQLWRLRA